MGLNIGKSDFRAGCGTGAFACDDSDTAGSIYFGSMFRDNLGRRAGLCEHGPRVARRWRHQGPRPEPEPGGQGATDAGVQPAGQGGYDLWPHQTTSAAGSGVAAGSDNGFGLSYGIGASYDFTPNVAATINWDSHDFRFAGGRDPVRMTSVGLQYKF
jgi:OOP family OmpA-OmpF porin